MKTVIEAHKVDGVKVCRSDEVKKVRIGLGYIRT
jgi:hypothetical protein